MVQCVLRTATDTKPALKVSIDQIDLIINRRHGNPTIYMKCGAAFHADRTISVIFGEFAKNNAVRDMLVSVPVLHPDSGGMDRRSAEGFISQLRFI